MIISKIHVGSGLGNQLHSYLMGRIVALDKGYDYGFVGVENFKGNSFMNLDWGKPVDLKYHIEYPAGKLIVDSPHMLFEEVTHYYNPEINFVKDGTVIDGYWQDERYFEHWMESINKWLTVEPMEMPDDLCVIGFRGGEYVGLRDLFLTTDYWDDAIEMMREINPDMKFEVHTDDPHTASKFFPDFKITHDVGINWRSVRYAKHLIIANSSFYILPSLLNQDVREVIAPRYWGRRNTWEWHMPQNYYKKFKYI